MICILDGIKMEIYFFIFETGRGVHEIVGKLVFISKCRI